MLLAHTFNASITILHVPVKDGDAESFAAFYIGQAEWDDIKKKIYNDVGNALFNKKREKVGIEDVLFQFIEKVKSDGETPPFITDEIIVKNGEPAEVILDQARKRNCDLIVMGIGRQQGIAGTLAGKTARRVLKKSTKPVFSVPY